MCFLHNCIKCEELNGSCYAWIYKNAKCRYKKCKEFASCCNGTGHYLKRLSTSAVHCHCCGCQECCAGRKYIPNTNLQTGNTAPISTPFQSQQIGQHEQHGLATPATGGVQNAPGGPHSTQSLSTINLDEKLEKVYAVRSRPGQAKFRKEVLQRCNQRCVVTGCDTIEALEAAHIIPFSDSILSDQENPRNGIALRADVHTLFDLGLLYVYQDGANLLWKLDKSVKLPYLHEVDDTSCNHVFHDSRTFLENSGRIKEVLGRIDNVNSSFANKLTFK